MPKLITTSAGRSRARPGSRRVASRTSARHGRGGRRPTPPRARGAIAAAVGHVVHGIGDEREAVEPDPGDDLDEAVGDRQSERDRERTCRARPVARMRVGVGMGVRVHDTESITEASAAAGACPYDRAVTRVLYGLGRACVRFRWPVIAAWIAVAVVLHVAAASAGQDWNDNLTLPGTGSTRATDLLQERLPAAGLREHPDRASRTRTARSATPASKDAIDETVKNLKAMPHVIRVVSPLDPDASALLSKDRRSPTSRSRSTSAPGDTATRRPRRSSTPPTRRKDAGLERRVGRLRRPEALEARDRVERGDRARGRGGDPRCSRSAR